MKTFIFLFLFVSFSIAHSQSLRLTRPNGGEKFLRGSDILIQWEGSQSSDLIQLEYTTNNGIDWNFIDTTRGTSYIWKNASIDTTNQCLIRLKSIENNYETSHIQFLKNIINIDVPIYSVKFSSDDKLIVFSYANVIEVRDLENDTIIYKLVKGGFQFDFDISNDNRFLAYGNNGNIEVMNLKTGIVEKTFVRNNSTVSTVKFSNDGKTIVCGGFEGGIFVWDVETTNVLHSIPTNNKRIVKIKFDQNDDRFVTTSHDSTVKVWDVENGSLLYTFLGHNKGVWAIEFADNGKKILSVSEDSTLMVWNIDNGEILKTIKSDAWIWSVTYDTLSKLVYFGNNNGKLHCASIYSDFPNFSFKAHNDVLRSVDVNSQSNLLATSSWDNSVKLWKINPLYSQTDQTDLSFSIFEEATSVNNLIAKEEIITVTQNQNSNTIDIRMNLTENGISTLKIYNANGMLIENKELSSIGTQSIQITTDSFSSGNYHIILTTPTRSETASFVLVK